jgi:acyl-CoA reductase-like NAD-dependent aldehyde dehydrogenase
MSEYRLLIDGKPVAGDGAIDVINPATEEVIAQCPTASATQLEQAVAAARRAFPAWSATPLEERQRLLQELVNRIVASADEMAELLVAEQGKPLAQARGEVTFAQIFCGYFADQALEPRLLSEEGVARVELHHKPLGVVAAITPWNFPYVQAVYKLAPALLTGNTIVIKPSPNTPLTTLKLGELVADLFPAGVVNIITDNNDLGALLTSHPGIDKVSFTGSTATGRKIMAAAAPTLKRMTLELGGNDAGIVLDDADPAAIAPALFEAAFGNSGQVCAALKRLYVHESLYDAVCEEVAALAEAAVVGDGMAPDTQFGPIQNRGQFDKVCSYLEDARRSGRIVAGGAVPDSPGYFVPLTVVRDIDDSARVVSEERFGPILPILSYTNIDEVVELAPRLRLCLDQPARRIRAERTLSNCQAERYRGRMG